MLTRILLVYLAAITVLTFGIYGYDKHQARNNKRRIPESLLHLLAVLGGTPGAFAGQRIFHHKTKKLRFMAVFTVIALIQIAIIIWLYARESV